MRASPIKTSFNAGELSQNMAGRVDLDKYGNACDKMVNMIPLVQGPAMRRPGTMFVAEVNDSTKQTWLYRFEFNYQQSFILEFSPLALRFYFNQGLVLVGGNPYVVTTPFTEAMLTNFDGTFGLSLVQSNDVVYIACGALPPYKLTRISNTNWTLAPVIFSPEPFGQLQNSITPPGIFVNFNDTSLVLTSSAPLFNSTMLFRQFFLGQSDNLAGIQQWQANTSYAFVGLTVFNGINLYMALNSGTSGYVGPVNTINSSTSTDGSPGVTWQFINSGFLYLVITGIVNSQTANVSVVIPQNNNSGPNLASINTYNYALSAWVNNNYPVITSFFRERLIFALGQTIWFSVSSDFENFAYNQYGEVTLDSALSVNIQSDDTAQITYLIPTARGLIVGTTSGECIVTEATTNEPFGPGNVKVSQSSGYGGKSIKPVRIDDMALFVQRSGKKIRETRYAFEVDAFIAKDITIMADHITGTGVTDMSMQREPYSIVWLVREDGTLLGLTYNKEQDVIAFHRHPIADLNFAVESVACIPDPTGDYDDLWLVGRITINGVEKRYVMFMQKNWEFKDVQSSMFYVDVGSTYNFMTPTTLITGLEYLEGETVQVLADGAVQSSTEVNGFIVNGGQITINTPARVVQVGLRYTPLLRTMRIEAGSADGTSQGKKKRFSRVVIRFLNTLGALIGCPNSNSLDDETKYDNIILRQPADLMNNPLPVAPYSLDYETVINDQFNFDGRIAFTQTQPLPMTVVAIMPQVLTNDKG